MLTMPWLQLIQTNEEVKYFMAQGCYNISIIRVSDHHSKPS